MLVILNTPQYKRKRFIPNLITEPVSSMAIGVDGIICQTSALYGHCPFMSGYLFFIEFDNLDLEFSLFSLYYEMRNGSGKFIYGEVLASFLLQPFICFQPNCLIFVRIVGLPSPC